MARPRNKRKSESATSTNNPDVPIQSKGETVMTMDAFIEIEDDELNSAIQGSRTRGVYDENLLTFFSSGRRGVQINLEEGVHEGKKSQSVKTGYESARERLVNGKITDASEEQVEAAKNTQVIGKTNPDRVFLVRKDVASSS